ncbi:MAG: hypothetical protein BAJALOKI2v1_120063 [Promethearchaeota archaeon]|nr:MAG: hypothetical protein BAJALOKI2v1_120063 [Candidatus Lokiarchaeota archaeon]
MNKIKEEIVSILIEHARIVYSVVSDMGVYYKGWAENSKDQKSLENKKSKMEISEEDADSIKIQLIQEYAEVGAQGLGDYVELILRMDNVINSALEFVDILSFIDPNVDEEIKSRYHKLINEIISMTDSFKRTIKSLRDKPDVVFSNTTTIHELENKVDLIYRDFLNYIYNDENLEIRQLLRIRDSIMTLEELADRIHDIADVIRVLLYQ